MKQITEDSNGTEIHLTAGETFEVRLEENRSTGFKWVIESPSEGANEACSLAGDSFEKGKAVGEPGNHHWEFRADHAGSCTITLSYQRPWESGQSTPRSFKLNVRVSK
ncbi:MAG TPA: protease inhibitor I42 family protein [Blastocatellia bacterium]|nr:protease inhibitor I42 family protein [Blastocatellia bacterium]